MKHIIVILVLLLCLFSCKTTDKSHPIIEYLEQNSTEPIAYVIEKFKDHDVIFIGENHYIKEQVDFVKELIPELYKNGVYNLGTEFLNYEDTELANKLITDVTFDQRLAEEISYKSTWHWGYQEYIDIYKKAWELNQSLPKDAKKFKIFGIQEVTDFSHVITEEDFNNPEIMKKVFSGSYEFDEEEGYSAHAIQKEVLDVEEKALIHCGIHHGFTSYYQPMHTKETGFIGGFQKERMGNLIKNKIGDRTMTLYIHGPWVPKEGYFDSKLVLPANGVLDSIFSLTKNEKYLPFGVDTKQTPLGDLKDENSLYQYGYDNFSLKDFCDGYIFLKPVHQCKAVTPIANFIQPNQVDYVKSQELDYRNADLTANDLNDSIKIWLQKEQVKLIEIKK